MIFAPLCTISSGKSGQSAQVVVRLSLADYGLTEKTSERRMKGGGMKTQFDCVNNLRSRKKDEENFNHSL